MKMCLFISALALCAATATSAENWKVVDAVDLSTGTNKYKGKDIQLNAVRCFYADVGDYRCTTESSVSVFTPAIEPVAAKAWVEDHCDTVKKALSSPACRIAIKFNYTESSQDLISGYQRRIVIRPSSILIDPPAAQSARGRR